MWRGAVDPVMPCVGELELRPIFGGPGSALKPTRCVARGGNQKRLPERKGPYVSHWTHTCPWAASRGLKSPQGHHSFNVNLLCSH